MPTFLPQTTLPYSLSPSLLLPARPMKKGHRRLPTSPRCTLTSAASRHPGPRHQQARPKQPPAVKNKSLLLQHLNHLQGRYLHCLMTARPRLPHWSPPFLLLQRQSPLTTLPGLPLLKSPPQPPCPNPAPLMPTPMKLQPMEVTQKYLDQRELLNCLRQTVRA